jgi:hypothetical protein
MKMVLEKASTLEGYKLIRSYKFSKPFLDNRINTYEKATYFEKAIVFLGIEKY